MKQKSKFVIGVHSDIVDKFCEAAHGVYNCMIDAINSGREKVFHSKWCILEKRSNGDVSRCSRVFKGVRMEG